MKYLKLNKENSSWEEVSQEEYDLRYEKYTGGYNEAGDYCVCPCFTSSSNNGGWAGPCYNCSFSKKEGCSWINPSLMEICDCCGHRECGCDICFHGNCRQHGRCHEPGCFDDPICDYCGNHESGCNCHE